MTSENVIFPFFGKVLNLLGTKNFDWKKCGPRQRYPEKTYNLGWDGLDLPLFWSTAYADDFFAKLIFFCPPNVLTSR